jgi:hypothetical protein
MQKEIREKKILRQIKVSSMQKEIREKKIVKKNFCKKFVKEKCFF